MFTPQEFPGRGRTAIKTMAPILNLLDLLSDDDLATVDAYLERAELAAATASALTGHNAQAARTIGVKLAADPKLDAAKLLKGAAELQQQAAVDAVAQTVYDEAVRAARTIAFARAGELPGAITERFDQIGEDFETLKPQLVGVRSDRDAIETGAVEAWKEFRRLEERYDDLRGVQRLASENSLIATARLSGDWGEWFKFRLPADKMNNLGSDDFGRFAEIIRRQPYVPSTTEQALAVRDEWQKEGAA